MPLIQMLLGNEMHPGGPSLTRKLASTVMIGRKSNVLDVACGRGESARVIAGHFGCKVVGVDYSSVNTSLARTLTGDAGQEDQVRFIQCDAEQLPFDDASFDVIICECSLCIFPNLGKALQEFRRVLRPGGRLGMSDVVLQKPLPESLKNFFGHVLCISGALSIDGYRDALESAGYASIRNSTANDVLNGMLERIERRAGTISNLMNDTDIDLGPELKVPRESIAEARDFVKMGGLGYVLFSARTPRGGVPTLSSPVTDLHECSG